MYLTPYSRSPNLIFDHTFFINVSYCDLLYEVCPPTERATVFKNHLSAKYAYLTQVRAFIKLGTRLITQISVKIFKMDIMS